MKRLWRKNFLRIETWNLELNKKNMDMCAISKTEKKGKGIIPCNDYILLFSDLGRDKRGKAGVGILIYKKFEEYKLNYRFVSEQIMVLSLKIKNEILDIQHLCIRRMQTKIRRENFYELFQREVDNI